MTKLNCTLSTGVPREHKMYELKTVWNMPKPKQSISISVIPHYNFMHAQDSITNVFCTCGIWSLGFFQILNILSTQV